MPSGNRPDSSLIRSNRRARRGSVALAVGSAGSVAAALILVYAGVTTASARIMGQTDNEASLLQAATLSLEAGDVSGQATTDLLVDASGLYPGLAVERCLPVRYRGSLPSIALVLSVEIRSGTGLDRYLDTTVTAGTGDRADCNDFADGTGPDAYQGTLFELARRHPAYDQGLSLADMATDDPVTLRFRFEVLDDNRAQGLSTDVRFRFEVRP